MRILSRKVLYYLVTSVFRVELTQSIISQLRIVHAFILMNHNCSISLRTHGIHRKDVKFGDFFIKNVKMSQLCYMYFEALRLQDTGFYCMYDWLIFL